MYVLRAVQNAGLQGGTKESGVPANSSSILASWGEWELHRLVAHFLAARFPILLALNKVRAAAAAAAAAVVPVVAAKLQAVLSFRARHSATQNINTAELAACLGRTALFNSELVAALSCLGFVRLLRCCNLLSLVMALFTGLPFIVG
jgi:hypothetical protein